VSGFEARYYDGRSTAATSVVAELRPGDDGRLLLHLDGLDPPRAFALSALRPHAPVGRSNRMVELPDGAWLEFAAGGPFDAVAEPGAAAGAGRLLVRLERRWSVALAALAISVLGVWLTVRFGVPAMATRAAAIVPATVDAEIGAGGLTLLDQRVFKPSELTAVRQRELRRAFEAIAADLAVQGPLRLEFRRGGEVGANAFALPAGIVVVTDELVQLAQHDDELRAVFAHEIGHVVNRHSMRMLLQSSTSALLMLLMVGDLSVAGSLVASIPTVLVHAAHSRDFEREADRYAHAWLRSAGIPLERLGDLLARLEAQDGRTGWSYLSTHPRTEERAGGRRFLDREDTVGQASSVPVAILASVLMRSETSAGTTRCGSRAASSANAAGTVRS
jgi:Zn-dependent protease with chaperone function